MHFHDRQEAGQLLAQKLEAYAQQPAIVYALPRGGVVTGAAIATALHAPLDLVMPRKIGHPRYPEYAVCAVTENGHMICNQDELQRIDPTWLQEVSEQEQQEAIRRKNLYLAERPPLDATGKVAIIADDGIATGLTMVAAIYEVSSREPAKIVVAIPVIPKDIVCVLQEYVDEVITLDTPLFFQGSVSAYYETFEQVEDEAVLQLLHQLPPHPQTQKEET
jgi:predicted phosphoribosyltransferase